SGLGLITLPALTPGTYRVRARVSDMAGNQGTSTAVTFQVVASTGWPITDITAQPDPFSGDPLRQRGDLTLVHTLDWDQSPGTAAGAAPALAYNAARVPAKPIIQAQLKSDSSTALPPSLTARLTFNGTTQAAVTYSTTGLSPGDLITVAQQAASAVTATGRYTYALQVTVNYGSPLTTTIHGATFVDVEDSSPFGAGWTVA